MADQKLAGKHVLMVIAPEQFRDEELLEPKHIFTEAGAKVTVASTKPGRANGMLGAEVRPDAVLDSVRSQDFHAIVVVGGMGSPEYLWTNEQLHRLLKECHQAGKVTAAICLSGAVLANAGILSGKKATVWAMPESLAALESGKATYVKDHVVSDGTIVTADGPDAAHDFGQAVAAAMQRVSAAVG